MINKTYDAVDSSPVFDQLVRKRNAFAVTLSAIVLAVYFAFVLFASTRPDLFATPVTEGSFWVYGLLIGWGIQIFAFLMTGVYVNRANGEFDDMTQSVISEATR
jgi:uncharacterized membrane protein (DUF485 family)